MPKNWKTYKLGELCTKITDGAHHSPKDIGTGGYPMPSVKDLTPFGLNLESSKRISELDYFKLIKQGCQPIVNDVVIAKDGNSALDTVCVIKKSVEAVLLSSVAILRPDMKLIDPYFLKCYFSSPAILKYLKSRFISGAAIPRVILKDFKLAEINLPPLPEQRVIASILSAIDDKIENNLSMNKTLEDMAMALYKHWFIDFGPFQEGKFVDSELGKIPEGWEVVKLEQLVEIKYGKDHKKLDKGSIPVYGSGGIMRYVDTFLYDSESVLVPRKGTLSNIFLVNQPFWSVDTMFYTKMRKENILKYTFHLLKTMKLADMDVGSAIPSLTTKLLNFLDVILPDEDVLRKFEIHVTELYEQIWANTEENKTLTQLRDTLLPKLISGKVRLAAFEEEITAAL